MIHRIEETTSTNDDARDAKYRHGDIVWAERQTAGRGQRGHKWSSAEGLNLTFSLVLEPRFLPAGEQFLLNEAVALALTDTFAQFGIAARIKWTNDIYAGDKKLVGILIEHSYSGQTLARTIVGIGINVNQTEFDPALPKPWEVWSTFTREVFPKLSAPTSASATPSSSWGSGETLQRDYRERMYRLGNGAYVPLPRRHADRGLDRGRPPLGRTAAAPCRRPAPGIPVQGGGIRDKFLTQILAVTEITVIFAS